MVLKNNCKLHTEVKSSVKRSPIKNKVSGFLVDWVACENNSSKISKDYEISIRSAQLLCTIAAFHTLLKRF